MSTEAERKTLGDFLRGAREACRMTIADVEKATDGVSAEYIARLESAEVAFPSPHILYHLAGAYTISYKKLMELAGHIRPNPRELRSPEGWNPLPKP